MSITYNASTNFGAKDALPINDPNKVIYGAQFTTEFNGISAAFANAAPTSAPTFTGTATFSGDLTIGGESVSDTDVQNWNTAHGWGDHADEGYLTSGDQVWEQSGADIYYDAGNVGIGVDTASGFLAGTDTGAITYSDGKIGVISSGQPTAYFKRVGSVGPSLLVRDASATDVFTVMSDGNVGIGESAPQKELHINNSSTWASTLWTGAGGGSLEIKHYDDTDTNGAVIGAGGALRMFTGGSERMRIASAGDATFTGDVTADNLNTTGGDIIRATHSGLHLSTNFIAAIDSSGSLSNGAVDLGVSPYKFKDGYFSGDVTASSFSAANLSATSALSLGNGWSVAADSTKIVFQHNGSNRLKVDTSGNLTVGGNVTAYGSP